MQVTEGTKFIANEILDYLRQFPERHNQSQWVSGFGTDIDLLATTQACNSTMCVAGTAVFLTTPLEEFKRLSYDDPDFFEIRGAEILGLNDEEASDLFYSEEESHALKLLEAVAEGDPVKFSEIADN